MSNKVIVASPIKDTKVIDLIKDLYKKKMQFQNLLLFTLAINTGLNLKDLLNLKVKNVKNKQYLNPDKNKSIPLNEEVIELIDKVIENKKLQEPLFQNSSGNKINRTAVFYSFKEVCQELGLSKKYSVASWRKTFAYHYYHKYKDLSYLQWLFNQTNIKSALKYIDEDENMNLRFRQGVNL